MFVVWSLLGALAAWPLLGASIGIAAALTKRFPVAYGIVFGSLLGPLAFLMFYLYGVAQTDFDPQRTIYYGPRSRYAARRCPECTGPNDLLTWQGTKSDIRGGGWGDFVPASRLVFTHNYKCIVCGYEWQFESPVLDPDKPSVREF
jgi:rubredoxin